MQFRTFGKLEWQASALGFGCMRLPTLDGKPQSEQVDEREAVAMIRYAIDHGVNYIDAAYSYHNGASEVVLGKALREGYRERVKLATKSPVWMIQKAEDFDTHLDVQLKRLKTGQVDFYLLHALNKPRWESILRLGVLRNAEAALQDGRIGHLGFSFHDNAETFKAIVDAYEGWTVCQIQYNYMDTENQAGTAGLRYASAKGLAVVVMEPLLGGRLANPPGPVGVIFEAFDGKRSPADWALQWVWDQPEVSLVLSGMTTMDQVAANVRSAERSAVRAFGAREFDLIGRVRAKYLEKTPIPCTKCGYCLPCPNGVNIPRNFELYNDGFIHEEPGTGRMLYARFMGETERAAACTQCGVCEEKCPQEIPIGQWMPKVHAVLGEGNPYA
ncbi:MAG: aldo/keto reductase [Candidatus Aminicenantes bacterium]|nr:aldo/keto reductase [Candidatus Aminicenantes bacterium]